MEKQIAREPYKYIYTIGGIYELLCSEQYFYDFLHFNQTKGFSVSEGLEILEMSGKIKFIG